MTPKIVDASVAIKWFVDEPTGREKAIEILDAIKEDPKTFVVPDLFFVEMLSVLARLTKSFTQLSGYIEDLQNLGFQRVGFGADLLKEAARFTQKQGLSGYDAIYAATASLMDGIWITADAKAHKKIESLKISELI